MVACAVCLVDFVSGGEYGVKGVHTHAALEAGGGFLPQQALHLYFLNEVAGGLVNVGKAVDPLARVGGNRGHQVLVLGLLGQIVGHTDRVEGGAKDGVVHGTVYLLAKHVNLHLHLADALNILFTGHKRHFNQQSFLIAACCLHADDHMRDGKGQNDKGDEEAAQPGGARLFKENAVCRRGKGQNKEQAEAQDAREGCGESHAHGA